MCVVVCAQLHPHQHSLHALNTASYMRAVCLAHGASLPTVTYCGQVQHLQPCAVRRHTPRGVERRLERRLGVPGLVQGAGGGVVAAVRCGVIRQQRRLLMCACWPPGGDGGSAGSASVLICMAAGRCMHSMVGCLHAWTWPHLGERGAHMLRPSGEVDLMGGWTKVCVAGWMPCMALACMWVPARFACAQVHAAWGPACALDIVRAADAACQVLAALHDRAICM
jgi:hypothetical protein